MGELYQKDCYVREFESSVIAVNNERFIILDITAFYPTSGGQLHDTGIILNKEGKEFRVLSVVKESGKIIHEVDKVGLKEGDKVKCKIDWDRRYKLMRYHTAAHILSSVINKETGAKISGNQLYEDKARVDFNLDEYDKDIIKGFVESFNKITKESHEVKTYFISKDDTEKMPESAMLLKGLPEHISEIRVVDVVGISKQACGGTHVKNTDEIGIMEITKTDNKGKNNRRLHFVLK